MSNRLQHPVSLFMLCASAFVWTACEQEIQPGWSSTPAPNATQPQEYWVAAVGLAGQLRRIDPDAPPQQVATHIALDVNCFIESITWSDSMDQVYILGTRSGPGAQYSPSGVYAANLSDGSTKLVLSIESMNLRVRMIRAVEKKQAIYLFGENEDHYRLDLSRPDVDTASERIKRIDRDPSREPSQLSMRPGDTLMRLRSKRYGPVEVDIFELPPVTLWKTGSAVLRTPGFVTFDAAVVPVDAVENEPSTPANDNHGSDN